MTQWSVLLGSDYSKFDAGVSIVPLWRESVRGSNSCCVCTSSKRASHTRMQVAVLLLPADSISTASKACFYCQIPSQLLWICCVQVVREVAGSQFRWALAGWLICTASMQEVQEDPARKRDGDVSTHLGHFAARARDTLVSQQQGDCLLS